MQGSNESIARAHVIDSSRREKTRGGAHLTVVKNPERRDFDLALKMIKVGAVLLALGAAWELGGQVVHHLVGSEDGGQA